MTVKTSLLSSLSFFVHLLVKLLWTVVNFVLSVMEPLASVAQLRLNMKPERDNFTIPKIVANVVFEEIVIVFGKQQVCGFFNLFLFNVLFFTCEMSFID